MKRIIIFFASLLLNGSILSAQQLDWIQSTTVNWTFNPEMPAQFIIAKGGKVFHSHLTNGVVNFGLYVYGDYNIECRDASGSLIWMFHVGSKAYISGLDVDVNGNLLVTGSYMETLQINGTDSLNNTGTVFDQNHFLLAIDAAGSLLWKRNLSLNYPNVERVGEVHFDSNGNGWYLMSEFQNTFIMKTDAMGQDLLSYTVQGIRVVHSFSFDDRDNMYVTGSTQSGTIIVNGFPANVTEAYMIFVTRIDVSGNCSWVRLAHDGTFQAPQVVATINGEAYIAAGLLDTSSFGSIHFKGPQWLNDIFVVKVDSTGNFHWGIEMPVTPAITGDILRGKANFISADSAGNLYLTGDIRGTVDWGNGVVSSAGAIPNRGVTIVSFDNQGIPRWQMTGTGSGFNTTHAVYAAGIDECYFACSATDAMTFDNVTVNTSPGFVFILGKIAPATTGIQNINNETSSLFPNPARDYIFLKTPVAYSQPVSGLGDLDGELVIHDMTGKIVSRFVGLKPGNIQRFDVSHLSEGVYYAIISGNFTTVVLKMVKQ